MNLFWGKGLGKCRGRGALGSVSGVTDSDSHTSQGVVPYLGTFLKDLVMLDAASKDELEVSSVCVCAHYGDGMKRPQGQTGHLFPEGAARQKQ